MIQHIFFLFLCIIVNSLLIVKKRGEKGRKYMVRPTAAPSAMPGVGSCDKHIIIIYVNYYRMMGPEC